MMTNRRTFVLLGLAGLLMLGARGPAQDAKAGRSDEVFTIVLLPDTQFYSEKYPETYVAQTMWIRERVKPDNIKFVVCLGDIVQNAHVEDEWKRADQAAHILDGVVPYSAVPGNHDLVMQDKTLTRNSEL